MNTFYLLMIENQLKLLILYFGNSYVNIMKNYSGQRRIK